MRGYLSVLGVDSGAIRVDSRVAIYRDPEEDSQEIIARKPGKTHRVDVRDVTVSRLKNGTPPVIIEPRQSCIEICNRCNTNGVTVVCDDDERNLSEGRLIRVEDTSTITVGYQTEFRLTVKEEATTQIDIGGDVGGDVVAGDRVDRGTEVIDSVVNRADVGGEAGSTVEDSIVNRSTVGGQAETSENSGEESDTQNHCQEHQRMYSGDVCPDCAKERATVPPGNETFCMFCGTPVATNETVCLECRE